MALTEFGYKIELTGTNSPSQNGQAEKWNNIFTVTTRALLYEAALEPKYWSAALLHASYLHNRRVHSRTGITLFEGWWGAKLNLKYLKLFGARVCVKQTGDRCSKLDKHNFTGLFLGYTSTDQNICYFDLNSGNTKTCHHATFNGMVPPGYPAASSSTTLSTWPRRCSQLLHMPTRPFICGSSLSPCFVSTIGSP
jgi:hypothetical protein